MTTIVYNTAISALKKDNESFVLRTGYIISDKTVIAGSAGADMVFDETFKRLNMRQKMVAFERWYGHEYGDILQSLKESFKAGEKIKHKSTQQIVALKKLEQAITQICNEMVKGFMEMQSNAGFDVIKQLINDDVFELYDTDINGEKEFEPYKPASKLLQRMLPAGYDEDAIFFLLPEFLYNAKYPTGEEESNEDDQQDSDKEVSVCPLFTLPNINILSAPELKAVRKNLEPATAVLRQHIDAWAKLFYNNTSQEEHRQYLEEKLVPAAEDLQKLIAEDKILQHCNRLQHNKLKIEVCTVEISVYHLWYFYRHYKVITDDTWKILEQLQEQEILKDVYWPVLALRSANDEAITFEATSKDTVPLKKSISVD